MYLSLFKLVMQEICAIIFFFMILSDGTNKSWAYGQRHACP